MKSQICRNCTYYEPYYIQMADFYKRLNSGQCSKCNKPQIPSETCECFRDNELREKKREGRRMRSLELALNSVNDIAQILKDKEKG